MKIKEIVVQNVLGAKDVLVKVTRKVVLVAGDNFSGKSSTKEAIYQAIANQATRTDLKKDNGALVTEGSKKGSAAVYFEGGSGSIALPKGTHTFSFDGVSQSGAELMQMAMPFCLDNAKLAHTPIDDRRRFLMKLMKVRTGLKDMLARLIAEGADEAKATEIVALLPAGFPAAVEEAQAKAREKKALWKATTRENWGSEKAGDWALHYVTTPDLEALDIKKIESSIDEANQAVTKSSSELALLIAEQKVHKDNDAKRTALKVKVATLPFAEEILAEEIAKRNKLAAEVESVRNRAAGGKEPTTYPCPCCAAVLEIVDGKLVEYVKPEKIADEEAKAELASKEAELTALEKSVESSHAAVNDAKNAAAGLTALPEQSTEDYSNAITEKNAAHEKLKTQLAELNHTKKKLEDCQLKKNDADKKTADAKDLHEQIMQYLAIAELLSPKGIPSKLLAEAIQPFNDALAASADVAYWKAPSIDGEMNVMYGGRNYDLLSESEKWRCDALISEVVAKFSGLRFIILDRFDCLNAAGRADMVSWLDEVTESGSIETAIVFGTLKEKPTLPDSIQLVWMDNGTSQDWQYVTNSGGAPHWVLKERESDGQADENLIAA